jgi:hypothetical protein
MSKKELKALEEKERIQDYKDDNNPALEERKKILEERKAQEIAFTEARKAWLPKQKKKDFEDQRAKLKKKEKQKKVAQFLINPKEEST